MGQLSWEISPSSNLSLHPGEESSLWACSEPFQTLLGFAETFHVEEESEDERNCQKRVFTMLWVIQALLNCPGSSQHQATQRHEDAALN